MRKPYRAVDLFAGIGGIRLAFQQAFGRDIRFVFSSEINRHACDTYKANFGERPVGDIMSVPPKDVPDHDILLAGWPCFPEGTEILTRSGFKRIEEVTVGEEVLTHKGRFRKVLVVHKRPYQGELVVLKLPYGLLDLVCTPEHPVLVRKRWKTYNSQRRNWDVHFSEPSWVPAEEIGAGDWIGIPIPQETFIIEGRRVNQRDFFVVRIKEERKRTRHLSFEEQAVVWVKVVSRGAREYSGTVYNLEVEDDQSYCVPYAVHNCQSFSIAGRKLGLRDPRGNLFFAISNILEEKRPFAFLLENVWFLERHDQGRTFATIMHILQNELRYTVYHRVLNAKHYGVPQNRPRIFIVGFGEPIRFRWPEPSPQDPPRVGDVLERNPPAKYYLSQRYLESLKRHRERHQSLGNGFGYMLLDPDGVAHTLVIGGMGHERNLVKGVPPPNAYAGPGDDPSKPNSEGIRRLTPIECARLQGFPNPHKIPPLRKLPPEELQRLRARGGFLFPVSDTQIYRQTAESVAVPLVRRIAEQMRVAMEERSPLLGEEA